MADVPPVLDDAWQRALAAWDTPAQHDKLVELAGTHEAYAWLAARYRERVAENADDAVAKARLEQLQKATIARLMASASPRDDKEPQAYRATIAMLGILIIVIIASVVYAVVRSSTADEQVRVFTPGETK